VRALAVWLALVATATAAEPPRALLLYARGGGAERCPDEAAVRAAVTARLGRDPFRDRPEEAELAIVVSVRRRGQALEASIGLDDLHGAAGGLPVGREPIGRRRLRSRGADCKQLFAALELALALAIDPNALSTPPASEPRSDSPASPNPPPPQEKVASQEKATSSKEAAAQTGPGPATATRDEATTSPPPAIREKATAPSASAIQEKATGPSTPAIPKQAAAPSKVPPAADTERPGKPPPPPARTRGRVSFGALAAVGGAPGVVAGFDAAVGFRRGFFSLDLELRGDLPGGEATAQGVDRSLVVAELVPCAHIGVFSGCALLAAGAQIASGIDPSGGGYHLAAPYTAGGGRLALEIPWGIPLSELLAIRLHADLLAAFYRASLERGDVVVVRTAALAGAFGLALLVHFR
jgi:hypothetical protein